MKMMKIKILLAVVFSLVLSGGAFATTWTDSGADNLWENAANWNAGVPTGGGYALIDDGGAGSLVIASYNASALSMDVGLANSGTLSIDGGTVVMDGGINIGKNAGATGSITIEADGSVAGGWKTLQGNTLTLGESGGHGSLTNKGAAVRVLTEWFNIAPWSGTAHVQLDGGEILSKGLHVGAGGTMDIAGGTLIVAGDHRSVLGGLISSGQFTSYGVAYDPAKFEMDYDETRSGYTTIRAVVGALPPLVSGPSEFGFNYWPHGMASECLNDSAWPTNKPIIEADLDHIASLSGNIIRITFWPHPSSWHINWPLDPEYYQQTGRIAEFLALCHARDIKVIVCFSNGYVLNGTGPAWTQFEMYGNGSPAGFQLFLDDTVLWMNGFIDAIEASTYKDTVIYYDLQNEYDHRDQNIGDYARAVYDRSHAPVGKRGFSTLMWSPWDGDHDVDVEDLAYQLSLGGSRPLDFVEFHSYPAAADGLAGAYPVPSVEAFYDEVKEDFPDAAVVLGESGHSAPDATVEQYQQSIVADLAIRSINKGIKYHLGWMFWDHTPGPENQEFGWGDDPHTPKDVMGGLSSLLGSMHNPDMEILDGGIPQFWSAGGTVPVSFIAAGPSVDAASNDYYARLQANQSSGDVWMVSPYTPVYGGILYFNSYIRSNLDNVRMGVIEYDHDGTEIRRTEGASFNPAWAWNNYLQRTGSFSVDLLPKTEFVHVAIAGSIVENPSYLDVDTVSLYEKYSAAAKIYMLWADDYKMVGNGTAAMYFDSDGDGLNNLAEYGTGGNPTNSADQGNVPAGSIVVDGGSWLEYIHFERTDKSARGLSYTPEHASDLVSPAWTNSGIVPAGAGGLNTEFNVVTNRISTESKDQQFIRLQVELQE